jgi:hypothetical protein
MFARTSRGELVATILREHYLPGLHQGRPVAPNGYFEPTQPVP